MADDKVIKELEALKQQLDASLEGLSGRPEHVPMHEVVAGLLLRISHQHNEIQALKSQLALFRKLQS